jgi:hypothetical protein
LTFDSPVSHTILLVAMKFFAWIVFVIINVGNAPYFHCRYTMLGASWQSSLPSEPTIQLTVANIVILIYGIGAAWIVQVDEIIMFMIDCLFDKAGNSSRGNAYLFVWVMCCTWRMQTIILPVSYI